MNIADKIINDMAIKHDGFIMICDSCKHLYTGECDPKCESLSGFESIAKSLVAELVELRQKQISEPVVKKPVLAVNDFGDYVTLHDYFCPACKKELIQSIDQKFCDYCGQHIEF